MNCVRKHLSAVKGGRLAAAFRGRLLVSLIISDVVGDPLDVIASGPTAPDPTEFANALIVLEKYALLESVPPAVCRYLNDGAAGLHPETVEGMPGQRVESHHRQQSRRARCRETEGRSRWAIACSTSGPSSREKLARSPLSLPASFEASSATDAPSAARVHSARRRDDRHARRHIGEGGAEPGIRARAARQARARGACGGRHRPERRDRWGGWPNRRGRGGGGCRHAGRM